MDEAKSGTANWLGPVTFWFCAALALLALLGGLFVFFISLSAWFNNDHSFQGLDGAFDAIIGFFGSAAILASFLMIGILLRFAHWQKAPQASLALCIVATGFIFIAFVMYSGVLNSNFIVENGIVGILALLTLLVVALPPLLHWRRWRIMTENQVENEP